MQKIIFTLLGEMPSKKNAWKRSASGRVYIPDDVKQEIDAFLWQIKGTKGRPTSPITGPVGVSLVFYVKRLEQRDLDNMATTALDILQKAGVIANDKDVLRLSCIKSDIGEPKVYIEIEKL